MGGGLEVKDKLFEFGEFVGSEFCEGGIGRDQRVEYGLLIGDGKGHVVEMAFVFGEVGKLIVGWNRPVGVVGGG